MASTLLEKSLGGLCKAFVGQAFQPDGSFPIGMHLHQRCQPGKPDLRGRLQSVAWETPFRLANAPVVEDVTVRLPLEQQFQFRSARQSSPSAGKWLPGDDTFIVTLARCQSRDRNYGSGSYRPR